MLFLSLEHPKVCNVCFKIQCSCFFLEKHEQVLVDDDANTNINYLFFEYQLEDSWWNFLMDNFILEFNVELNHKWDFIIWVQFQKTLKQFLLLTKKLKIKWAFIKNRFNTLLRIF